MAKQPSNGIVSDGRFEKNIALLQRVMPQAIRDTMNEHALNVQGRTKDIITRGSGGSSTSPAVDTGAYRASIKIETFQNGLAKRVGSDLKYAIYIELGTGPRSKMPPLEPIRQWCKRHGIPESAAFVIARKIRNHGTPARPALMPAWEIERPKLTGRIQSMMAQVQQQVV